MKYDEILGYINEFNIGNMLPQVELHKSIDDDCEIDIDYDVLEEKSKIRKNDKGKVVPDKCPKCGGKVGVFIKGEPVYLCSNKKCKKYFGTVPCNFNESVFSNLLFLIENSTSESGEEFNTKRINVAKKMQDNLYLYLKKYVQNKEFKEKYKDYLYLIKIEKLPCTSYDVIVQITELQDGIDTEKYDSFIFLSIHSQFQSYNSAVLSPYRYSCGVFFASLTRIFPINLILTGFLIQISPVIDLSGTSVIEGL